MNDSLINMPDEVKHLSNSEIEELYERYLSGEKNSVLIAEYKIDVNPNKLIKVLPAKQLIDTNCQYCQIPMFEKRKSKSHSSWQSHAIECYQCGHKIFTNNGKYQKEYCNCKKCIDFRHQQEINEANKFRAIIEETHNLERFAPITYEQLSFTNKLILLTLFRIQTDEDFDYILSLADPLRANLFTPSDNMDEKYIESLYRSGILLIDPKSPVTAFPKDNPSSGFYLRNVQWIVNISIEGTDRSQLKDIYSKVYYDLKDNIKLEWEAELFSLLIEISTEEVLQYLRIKTEELNITFVAEKKTKEITEQLLIDFSVSEIYYFVKKSVEDAHIFYSKGFANSRKHAGNIIPGKMLSLGERALKENWETYKYNRDSRSPRSYLSQIIFDFLLQDEDAGFKKAIGKYWYKEIYPKYFESQDSTNDSATLSCVNCGSINVEANIEHSRLSLDCKDCGVKKEYLSKD